VAAWDARGGGAGEAGSRLSWDLAEGWVEEGHQCVYDYGALGCHAGRYGHTLLRWLNFLDMKLI